MRKSIISVFHHSSQSYCCDCM